jgi:hypothetical protein
LGRSRKREQQNQNARRSIALRRCGPQGASNRRYERAMEQSGSFREDRGASSHAQDPTCA